MKASHICFKIDCTASTKVDELAKKTRSQEIHQSLTVTSKQSYILWVILTCYLSPFAEERPSHKSHFSTGRRLLFEMSSSAVRSAPQDGGFQKQLEGGLK